MGYIYFGRGKLKKIKNIIKEYDATRIFLVTGKESYDKSYFRVSLEKSFKGKIVFRYSDFSTNPRYEDVIIGIKKIIEFSPDLIIGIGGGSVLDTAKLLSVLSNKKDNIKKLIKEGKEVSKRKMKLVLIPTTAGSGSEATHFAVVYIKNKKFSVSSKELIPDCVIIDPELTYDISKNLTIITLFDALSQAIESHWSMRSTKESRKYSAKCIRSIMKIFDKLIKKPNKNLRDVMMMSSHLAGKAINLTKTTAPHAFSYGFTSRHSMPHGQAVMLTLPIVYKFNSQAKNENIRKGLSNEDHKKRMNELNHLLGVKDSKQAYDKLNLMIKKSQLRNSLKSLPNVEKEQEIKKMIRMVNNDRLNNNPVIFQKKELKKIFEYVFY